MAGESEITLGDKVRYQVDRFMSWSPMARFLGLFIISFILILIAATLAVIVMPVEDGESFDLLEAMWWAMTRVADAGTMGDDKGTLVRAVATLSTLSGVMVVALLIGLVSGTIGEKIDDLRKGKSPIIDSDHTLILGWSEKVYAILRELRNANESRGSSAVIILSESDKEEVENAVKERMGDMGTTRVIVRQGSPFSPADLMKVGAGRARSIILLASDTDPDDDNMPGQADMGAIKTLLALRRIKGVFEKNHVTVELLESGRKGVIERLGAGGVEVVAMTEVLGRLLVQTVRQRGLAEIYRYLLSYDGSELYFHNFPELAGSTFSSVQWRLKDACAMGVKQVTDDGEKIILNPPESLLLGPKDELLVLAEDDDTFSLVPERPVEIPSGFTPVEPKQKAPENILIIGVGPNLGDILAEYDNYVAAGTKVYLMPGRTKEELKEAMDTSRLKLKNTALHFIEGDPTSPEVLKPVVNLALSSVMVVADMGYEDSEADARTAMTVLLLRELFDDAKKDTRIISEMLDPRTKELLEGDGAADFVVSSEITSMLLAQVSEQRQLNAVFADLFDSDGNEIYFKRAAVYAPLGQNVTWLQVQKVARSRGEVALGYMTSKGELVMNPPQDGTYAYNEADRMVVVAEDDREDAFTAGEPVTDPAAAARSA